MGQSASFPFEIGADPDRGYASRHRNAYWQLYGGKRKADGAEVSIFKLDKQAAPRLQLEAGQHGLQKMKSVRHPYILQYLEGADFEKELVLVTEPVTPLLEWLGTLSPAHREQQVAWGLRCLASALHFLGATNGMTHGAVCAHNVFVARGGDWKLGGLDLLCEWRHGGKDTLHFQLHEALAPAEYRAPERRNNNMDMMLKAAPGAMDVWALGVLLGEVAQATSEGQAPTTSGPLASIQRRCLNDNPPDRPSAAKILQHPLLKPPPGPVRGKELLYVLPFLETFSLQDDGAKVAFFQHLAAGPSPLLAALPPEVGLHKILPTFRDYVHIGGPPSSSSSSSAAASASASGLPPSAAGADALFQQPGRRQLVLAALPACLEILKGMGPDVFAREGEPLVVSLFGLQDRALRAMLLQSLSGLSDKLSTETVNGRLLDAVLAGFNDSAPQLRELTLKSMLCLSPRLTDRNLADRLMQRLAKLQADPEPSIRTNTTIFLGRVAPQLKDGARTRILLPAFLKACRDPFPHARLAGLKAAAACTAYFDPPSIATKLLPTVCCLLIDPDGSVRDAAFQCQDACLKLLTAHAQRLREEENRRRSEMAAKGGGAVAGAAGLGGMDGSGSGSGGGGGMLASATSSVAAWGGSLFSSSVGSSISSSTGAAPPSPPPPPPPPGKPPVNLVGGSSGQPRPVVGARGGSDDDTFFDSLSGPPAAGHRKTPSISSAADGWDADLEEDGWGDDGDGDGASRQSASATAASLGGGSGRLGSLRASSASASSKGASQPTPTASLGAMRLASSGSATSMRALVKPVTDDDLLSMLGDTPTRTAHAPPPAFSAGGPSMDGSASASTPSSASSLAAAGAAGPPKRLSSGSAGAGRPSRLQAKKLNASKASDWDDF